MVKKNLIGCSGSCDVGVLISSPTDVVLATLRFGHFPILKSVGTRDRGNRNAGSYPEGV